MILDKRVSRVTNVPHNILTSLMKELTGDKICLLDNKGYFPTYTWHMVHKELYALQAECVLVVDKRPLDIALNDYPKDQKIVSIYEPK